MHPVGKTVWAEIAAAMPASWEPAASWKPAASWEPTGGVEHSPAIPAPAPGPELWDSAAHWSMMAGTDTGHNVDRWRGR